MSDYNDGLVPEPCLRLDYGFGQEYASVELGDGTGYVRVTDDLRGEHHKMERWYDDELRAALDENAKLRTFIDLKETCWKYVGWCNECPYNGVDDEHDDCNCTVREKVNSLARELRIEVPR